MPYATQDDVDTLYDMGAVRSYRTSWEQRYEELCELRNTCQVNGIVEYDVLKEKGLAAWCRSQRFAYRQGSLPPERFERLDQIGFDWDKGDFRWLMKKTSY